LFFFFPKRKIAENYGVANSYTVLGNIMKTSSFYLYFGDGRVSITRTASPCFAAGVTTYAERLNVETVLGVLAMDTYVFSVYGV